MISIQNRLYHARGFSISKRFAFGIYHKPITTYAVPLRFKGFSPTRLGPTPIDEFHVHGIVVERSSIRGFAADCPIYAIFKPSHLTMFHIYAVVCITLRGFQQFNTIIRHTDIMCRTSLSKVKKFSRWYTNLLLYDP